MPLDHLQAHDLYAVFKKVQPQFQILENGFGTGEKFFSACACWLATSAPGSRLHYLAIEPHPVSRVQLQNALTGKFSASEKLAAIAANLLAHWPPAIEGFHTIQLAPDCLLTLVFADPAQAVPQIAGDFDDMDFVRPAVLGSSHLTSEAVNAPQSIVIIGAGIAGASVARAFARRGIAVTVLEREVPACGGSGNPVAVVRAEPGGAHNPVTTLTAAGMIWLKSWIAQQGNAIPHEFCGAIRLARDPQRHDKLAQFARRMPDTWLDEVTQEQASGLCGHSVAGPGFVLPYAGWLKPAALVHALLAHPLITVRTGVKVEALEKLVNDAWRIVTVNNQSVHEEIHSRHVVLASAFTAGLCPIELAIDSARGQLSYLPESSVGLTTIICRDGYITPAVNGLHTIGATIQKDDDDQRARAIDDEENFQRLQRLLPGFATDVDQLQSGRVAWRAVTQDRLPLVGALAPGLYASVAHGSRGITCAPLCGEWLAAMVMGELLPLPVSWRHLLDPLRFAVKI